MSTELKVTLVCTKCGLEKLTEEFYKQNDMKTGFRSHCKSCQKKYLEKWREENKQQLAETSKKWREKNKARHAETNKKWYKENPHKKCAKDSKRRALKLQAYPSWTTEADKMKIEGLFSQAKQMYIDTGTKHHLDHIHPLNPPKKHFFEGEWIGEICGLHAIHNLQILSEYENCSKSNKFECYVESELDPENPKPWEKPYLSIESVESA